MLEPYLKEFGLPALAVAVFSSSATRLEARADSIRTKGANILKDGKIPPEADLTGRGWEAIFGKPVTTARYKWQDVVRELESPDPWIYPLATLMWQAYDGQRVEYNRNCSLI
jgi:hypothetical protein